MEVLKRTYYVCLIYKSLQMRRHNYVIGHNEHLISTLSESTVP